jgi:hypothetical protein
MNEDISLSSGAHRAPVVPVIGTTSAAGARSQISQNPANERTRAANVFLDQGVNDRSGPTSLVDFAAMADIVEVKPAELQVELAEHTVITHPELKFRAPLQPLVWELSNLRPKSSTFFSTLARMDGGKVSNAREKVADQVWRAAATAQFGRRVVWLPAAISRRDWSSLALTSSVNSRWPST